jgi:hypothetical protein
MMKIWSSGLWRRDRPRCGCMVFSNDRSQVNGLIELISRMVVVVGVMGQCCVPPIQFVWPSQSCLQRGGCA